MITNPLAPFYSFLVALYTIIPLPILSLIFVLFGVKVIALVFSYFGGK